MGRTKLSLTAFATVDIRPPSKAKYVRTAKLCCVPCLRERALPSLLGRGNELAGFSGLWVGHSSGGFAVGLMSDREPGSRSAPGDSPPPGRAVPRR